jgi:hypothetical protein
VTDFSTVKEANDFLAARISAEAARENVPLSEVERKMLYFSETDWTLPDMKAVSDQFDQDYDQDEYEQKIARLIANITADRHHHNEDEEEKWDAAVSRLSDGDHYIQVLINEVGKPARGPAKTRSGDFLKLLLTAFAVVFALLALFALDDHFFPDGFWHTLGSHIDERAKPFLLVLLVAVGYFIVPKFWQFIRARSNRA